MRPAILILVATALCSCDRATKTTVVSAQRNAPAQGLRCEVTVESGPKLGGPIWATIIFENLRSEPVVIFRQQMAHPFDMDLFDSAAKPVPLANWGNFLKRWSDGGEQLVAPKSKVVERLDLSKYFNIDRPGEYKIIASCRTDAHLDDDSNRRMQLVREARFQVLDR